MRNELMFNKLSLFPIELKKNVFFFVTATFRTEALIRPSIKYKFSQLFSFGHLFTLGPINWMSSMRQRKNAQFLFINNVYLEIICSIQMFH